MTPNHDQFVQAWMVVQSVFFLLLAAGIATIHRRSRK